MNHLKTISVPLFLTVLLFSGCSKSALEANSNAAKTAAAPGISDFDSELKAMRTAEFDYIYALRRKDGKPMDSDDKKFVKNTAPNTTNRFTLTKDERAIFTGSNFKYEQVVIEALEDRFQVTDFSKPKEVIEKRRKAEQEKAKKKSG